MDSYRVKNMLWLVIISLFIVVALLSGCSSTPQQVSEKQFCYTNKEIRVKNGSNVSSETLVKCSDDPIERIVIKRAGMAENCGWTSNWITLPSGRTVNDKYITCITEGGRMVRINPDPS
jgi:hypothetical protein